MGKKKSDSGYDWIKADVQDGTVTFTYRVTGGAVDGRHEHDEDVSSWTDLQISQLGCDLLDVPRDCASEIVVLRD